MASSTVKEIDLKLPTDFSEDELRKIIGKKMHVRNFSFEILKQSLDARKKPDVFWQAKIRILSEEFKGGIPLRPEPELEIPYKKRNNGVVVVGSGPAGFFSAFVLQKAGFQVLLIEKGPEVKQRFRDILDFESGKAEFKNHSNYCHGEGGAGTFSDGKLTSRTKGIALEKAFVFESYVEAGAPKEILYLAKPHIGSDKLRVVIPNLRKQFQSLGGKIKFDTEVTDLEMAGKSCKAVVTMAGSFPCDMLIVAPGHSSYATYRMLAKHGIRFRTKPFAIGARVEHPQELINISQWGKPQMPGLKAADYKLTHTASNGLPVYSFCMCPGGKVVPSAPAQKQNIVNGVSDYARNSAFANSAVVAGLNLDTLLNKEVGFEEALRWMENLEQKVFELSNGYTIPGNRISDFIGDKTVQRIPANTYPFDVFPYDFREMLPPDIISALKEGLQNFAKKIHGFETGLMLGLESKTSSPVQVVRDEQRRCEGFENIFIVGEGSGYAGGITSSAVDGVKVAMGNLGSHL
ncbi:MAG: NAD(P)/FAD-dependent oxidoreductase [Bacteroidales bacterium]|nr:NAD(P)/FAD-dependent oxidoreductase [Bacteroidales bacterium]